jgi:hypothetical protein
MLSRAVLHSWHGAQLVISTVPVPCGLVFFYFWLVRPAGEGRQAQLLSTVPYKYLQ